MTNFEKCLNHTFDNEGGWSDHPADSGGKTMYGITQKTARAFGYGGDIKNLTRKQAEEIYKKGYWDNYRLDGVIDIRVAFKIFDTVVNITPSKVFTIIQRALNCLNFHKGRELWPNVTVDGIWGSQTLGAINRIDDERDVMYLLEALEALQKEHYIRRSEKKPSQKAFMRGWFKRAESRYVEKEEK